MTGLGSSCGACKFLRRKCTSECVFAPYFCYDEAATHFAAVHKVFGASNASKLLSHLPIHNRSDAAVTISYEALARIRDPIYGCVAHIFALQQQVATLQEEIEILINQMANHAVEVPVCGFPQVATYSDGKIELASLHETMSTLYNQDEQTTLPNHPGFIAGNQILDNQLCESLSSPSYEWEEDLNFLFNFYQNSPQLNLEGLESGVLIDNPCMGNSSATTNWEGPNWE